MGEKSSAFLKGGAGCCIAFAVVALACLLLGGSVHIDAGGVVLLFVMGGVLGLIVFAIYAKGRRDAQKRQSASLPAADAGDAGMRREPPPRA